MPVENYGVLKCKPVRTYFNRKEESPHFEVLCIADNKLNYRVSINVQSIDQPSALLYLDVKNFSHPVIHSFPQERGYFPLERNQGIDYIRHSLFNASRMTVLPHHAPGADNDLLEFLDFHIKDAIKKKAALYVFGSKFISGEKDRIFHFNEAKGIHNVHMNQGNMQKYRHDNGIYQDGAIFIYDPENNSYTAIFLAFQSQSWCTDDNGDPEKTIKECNHQTIHQ
jgi:uncharacterized protein YukJ